MQVTREREREQAELREILKAIEFLLTQKAILESLLQKALQKTGLGKNLENKTLNLETLKASLNDLPTPPANGWDRVKISNIADKLSAGGDKPKAFSETKTQEYQIPIYANALEKKGLYGYTDKPTITQNALTISARGTIGYAVARYEPFYPIVRLIVLIPKQDKANLKFLEVVINNSNVSGSGVNIPQLTVPEFSDIKIPLPPLEIQEQIISLVETIQTHITSLDEARNTLATQKQNILKDAL